MNLAVDGNEQTLFYDTYALYAITLGQPNYQMYSKGYTILTTIMNLYELYYTLNNEGYSSLAEELFHRLLPACVRINPEDIKNATHLRLANKKKNWSYVDSLGYAIALKENVSFLTGDKGFKDIAKVTYIK